MGRIKPFVVLALPRSGTKMLCSALSSHPQLPDVRHEFFGSEKQYREHPWVLCNHWFPFFEGATIIHVYREDKVAGAISAMMMSYAFPDNVVVLPAHEVLSVAKRRRELDRDLARHAHHSISYEEICQGAAVDTLPEGPGRLFCDWLGVDYAPMTSQVQPQRRTVLKNHEELVCLRV